MGRGPRRRRPAPRIARASVRRSIKSTRRSCSRRRRAIAASARGAARKLRVQQQAEKKTPATTATAAASRPMPSARAATAEPFVVRLRCRSTGTIDVKDELRGASIARRRADRRSGAAQVGRPADLSPRERRRRSPDGDHARDPRRGVDVLDAEARAALQAFGWEPPEFIHMPLLRNADKDKTKTRKRKNPISIDYYRDIGLSCRRRCSTTSARWAGPSATIARCSRSPR